LRERETSGVGENGESSESFLMNATLLHLPREPRQFLSLSANGSKSKVGCSFILDEASNDDLRDTALVGCEAITRLIVVCEYVSE
jgi:hypothetical protein